MTTFVAAFSIAATVPKLNSGWQWLLPVAQAQKPQPGKPVQKMAPLDDFDIRANLKRDLEAPATTKKTNSPQSEAIQETH